MAVYDTYGDLLRDALLEVGAIDPIDAVEPNLSALALSRLNGILDLWGAPQIASYSVEFSQETVSNGVSPTTIGPDTAVIAADVRPVAILGVNLVQGSGTSQVNIGPLTPRGRQWWLAQTSQNLQSGVPTDFYYEPTWPNGSLFLWPVPDEDYDIQLELRTLLAEAAAATAFSLPQGYGRALMLTLAEDLCGPLTVPMPPTLMKKAQEARGLIFANNNPSVRIRTRQAGMPGRGRTTDGNWVTGPYTGMTGGS